MTNATQRCEQAPAVDTGVRGGSVVVLWRVLRRMPVTVAVVVALWLVAAMSGALPGGPSPALADVVGVGVSQVVADRWWTPITSVFWAHDLHGYIWASLETALLLGTAERAVGSRRVLALAAIVQVLGTAAALGVVAVLGTAGGRWAAQLREAVSVGPTPMVFGVALAATGAMPTLWRRRLRALLLAGLAMLLLYCGLLSDVQRLASAAVGLVVGTMWFRASRRRDCAAPAPSPRELRLLVAVVVAASAIGPLVAVLAETRVGPLAVLRFLFASPPPDAATVGMLCADPATGGPSAVRHCAELRARLLLSGVGPAAMSIMPVLLLLVAAEGLRRGRRTAWAAALAINLALVALGVWFAADTAATPVEQRIVLGPGSHLHVWVELALPVLQPMGIAVLLVLTRSRFSVRAAREVLALWGARIAVVGAATAAAYVGGSLLVADQYVPRPGLLDVLADLPVRYLPPGYLGELAPGFLPQGFLATLLFEWTGTVFWAVVLLAGFAVFAPGAPTACGSDLARVRALLGRTSGSSLAHLATWPGQSYLIVTAGEPRTDVAAVGFRVIGGVALTTGEPVGDPRHHRTALDRFAATCRDRGWTPCLYGVGERVLVQARELGWSAVQVAEETVVPLTDLEFSGRKWQDVRTALNKADRAGITAEWMAWADAPPVLTDQIRAISGEWVADKGMPEMGFTLGGLDELADPDVRLMVAVDETRTVHGVTSWMPVRRDGVVVGWTLDLMRRRGNAFRGVSEFLIASAALHARSDGAEFLSLSGAPLARRDDVESDDTLQRVLDQVGRSLEPVYGFRSLLAFKAKFQPEYRPLYMTYPDAATLPTIAAAIGRAYLPEVRPRQLGRLARQLAARRPRARARPL